MSIAVGALAPTLLPLALANLTRTGYVHSENALEGENAYVPPEPTEED